MAGGQHTWAKRWGGWLIGVSPLLSLVDPRDGALITRLGSKRCPPQESYSCFTDRRLPAASAGSYGRSV